MSSFPRSTEAAPWQAVVFDLDDTLYPERDFVLSGFRAVAAWLEARIGVPAAHGYDELRALFAAGVRGNTFDRWLEERGLPAHAFVPEMVRVYREHEPRLSPFPEVPELLAALRRGSRLGLVSDGPLAVQRAKLAAVGLEQFFDAVVFSDAWGREAWKPSLLPFTTVLERLGTPAAASVYVADNPVKDFLGARRVGMRTVRVRRPGGEYAHLGPPAGEHAPHATIESLRDLEGALVRLR